MLRSVCEFHLRFDHAHSVARAASAAVDVEGTVDVESMSRQRGAEAAGVRRLVRHALKLRALESPKHYIRLNIRAALTRVSPFRCEHNQFGWIPGNDNGAAHAPSWLIFIFEGWRVLEALYLRRCCFVTLRATYAFA